MEVEEGTMSTLHEHSCQFTDISGLYSFATGEIQGFVQSFQSRLPLLPITKDPGQKIPLPRRSLELFMSAMNKSHSPPTPWVKSPVLRRLKIQTYAEDQVHKFKFLRAHFHASAVTWHAREADFLLFQRFFSSTTGPKYFW